MRVGHLVAAHSQDRSIRGVYTQTSFTGEKISEHVFLFGFGNTEFWTTDMMVRWLGSSGALFVTEPKDLWPSGAEGENAMAQVVLWLACAYHSTLYTINHKQIKMQKIL